MRDYRKTVWQGYKVGKVGLVTVMYAGAQKGREFKKASAFLHWTRLLLVIEYRYCQVLRPT